MTHSLAVRRLRRPGRLAATFALLTALVVGSAASPALARDADQPGAGTAGQWSGRSYVALGDSFTGGQGAPPYVSGPCLQTRFSSYPTIGAVASSYRLVSNNACSGASLADIPAQLAGVSINTKLVTITIGGIDAGSNLVFAACAPNPASDVCRAAVAASMARLATLGPELAATYARIAAVVPQARVVASTPTPSETAWATCGRCCTTGCSAAEDLFERIAR